MICTIGSYFVINTLCIVKIFSISRDFLRIYLLSFCGRGDYTKDNKESILNYDFLLSNFNNKEKRLKIPSDFFAFLSILHILKMLGKRC
jgi:hypothetical protein